MYYNSLEPETQTTKQLYGSKPHETGCSVLGWASKLVRILNERRSRETLLNVSQRKGHQNWSRQRCRFEKLSFPGCQWPSGFWHMFRFRNFQPFTFYFLPLLWWLFFPRYLEMFVFLHFLSSCCHCSSLGFDDSIEVDMGLSMDHGHRRPYRPVPAPLGGEKWGPCLPPSPYSQYGMPITPTMTPTAPFLSSGPPTPSGLMGDASQREHRAIPAQRAEGEDYDFVVQGLSLLVTWHCEFGHQFGTQGRWNVIKGNNLRRWQKIAVNHRWDLGKQHWPYLNTGKSADILHVSSFTLDKSRHKYDQEDKERIRKYFIIIHVKCIATYRRQHPLPPHNIPSNLPFRHGWWVVQVFPICHLVVVTVVLRFLTWIGIRLVRSGVLWILGTVDGSEIRRSPPGMYQTWGI